MHLARVFVEPPQPGPIFGPRWFGLLALLWWVPGCYGMRVQICSEGVKPQKAGACGWTRCLWKWFLNYQAVGGSGRAWCGFQVLCSMGGGTGAFHTTTEGKHAPKGLSSKSGCLRCAHSWFGAVGSQSAQILGHCGALAGQLTVVWKQSETTRWPAKLRINELCKVFR